MNARLAGVGGAMLAVFAIAVLPLVAGIAVPGRVQAQTSTPERVDPASPAAVSDTRKVALPLTQRWSVALVGQASTPLIADGRVFVLAGGAGSRPGTRLVALDALSGRQLWKATASDGAARAAHAWGDGRVYVLDEDGRLAAYDGASGLRAWSRRLAGAAFPAAPVFRDGLVLAGDAAGHVTAVDAATGRAGSPSAAHTAVFAVPRAGGGPAPAAVGDLSYSLAGSLLTARNQRTRTTLWRFKATDLVTAPLVVDDAVYVADRDGTLYARDRHTGDALWQTTVPARLAAAGDGPAGAPLAGLGAGEGLIVVPAAGRLVAYGN